MSGRGRVARLLGLVGRGASLRRRPARLAAALALGALLASCAAATVQLSPVPRTFTPKDYPRVYDLWTREAKEFAWSRLSDVLSATATFESWEFRSAYVVRYADDHGLDTAERDRLLAATLEDATRTHRFFVTMVGPNFRESDLTGRRAAFRVLLVDDDDRATAPMTIERVRRPSPAEKAYFPSVSPLRMVFRVAFPAVREDGTPTIPADAERVRLRFTGATGRVDLAWEAAGAGQK